MTEPQAQLHNGAGGNSWIGSGYLDGLGYGDGTGCGQCAQDGDGLGYGRGDGKGQDNGGSE